MSEIILSINIINNFLKHGEQDYPFECCGFILGNFVNDNSVGTEYIAVPNTKIENKERRFLIDPLEYQNAEDLADEKGLSIISIVHSHPDHPHLPSEFDKDHAWPGFSYIIMSVAKGVSISYKSWKLHHYSVELEVWTEVLKMPGSTSHGPMRTINLYGQQ